MSNVDIVRITKKGYCKQCKQIFIDINEAGQHWRNNLGHPVNYFDVTDPKSVDMARSEGVPGEALDIVDMPASKAPKAGLVLEAPKGDFQWEISGDVMKDKEPSMNWTEEEFLNFKHADREVINNLKRSPRCNEAKHHECTMEIKVKDLQSGKEALSPVRWKQGGDASGQKKWAWCECLCHVAASDKQKWMKAQLPSNMK